MGQRVLRGSTLRGELPKKGAMAQVSRPFQIALAAVLLFAVVWFVALQGHGSGSTPVATTPASTPAQATAAKAKAPAGSTHIEGMTRAVTHAREAVAASQQAADKAGSSSAEAPSTGASAATSSKALTTRQGATQTGTTVLTKHGAAGGSTTVITKHVVHTPAPHKTASAAIPAQQAAVERELKHGEVAVILFWNKKGADDVAVHEELQRLLAAHREIGTLGGDPIVRRLHAATGLELEKKIAVHYASAAQVTEFGSFTKTVQVYGTPTILIINRHGAVTTMNGLTDAFAIEQTVDEARQGS
jgi:hypothetical protein